MRPGQEVTESLPTFNDRWRRHDGFGLLAVAIIIAAAIAVGYLAGVR
jgi:hypothetical protein